MTARAPGPAIDASEAERPLRVLLTGSPADALVGALENEPRVELLRADRAILRQCRRRSPDVLAVAGPASPAVVRAALAAKATGQRVALVDHDGARSGRPARWLEAAADARTTAATPTLVQDLATAACRPGAGLHDGPPVTVIVTVLDEERAIERLLEQVVPQLRNEDELVVVDGGSSDATMEHVARWAERDPRIVACHAPGTNIAAGRNHGIARASNRIIATTDAGCTLSERWLQTLRRAFAEPSPPGLVAGNCGVEWDGPLQRAQAIACYPDPAESRRPSLFTRAYGRAFGQVFDPTLPFARSLAFSVDAWRDAGGFPEDLRWTEDGVFGRRVAASHEVRFAADAVVTWTQHGSLRATYTMYRQYGMGAASSGDRTLVRRDLARLGALGTGIGMIALAGRRSLPPLAAASIAYCSLPLRRVARQRAGLEVATLVPVAMACKDLGKISGALMTWIGERR